MRAAPASLTARKHPIELESALRLISPHHSITPSLHHSPTHLSALSLFCKQQIPAILRREPLGIYQLILAGKIEFPRFVETHARDLVRKLLTADRAKRLGNRRAAATTCGSTSGSAA